MGATIFADAVGGILRRPGDALRVSLLPALMALVAWAVLVGDAPRVAWTAAGAVALTEAGPSAVTAPEGAAMTARFLAWWVIAMTAAGWIGAGWHRVVLGGARPGWTPPVSPARLGAYFSVAFRLFVLLVGFGALLVLVSVAFLDEGGLSGLPGRAADLGVILAATYVSLRFGLVLPAAALGRPATLGESWDVTGAAWPAVLGVSALLTGASLLLGAAQGAIAGPAWLQAVASSLAAWLACMLGVGALTALYAGLLGAGDE
ncbi:MAG: hypothetical protein ACU0BS_03335 [Hasllibacter sp.]